jgi:20S proteasome alpha/beta subunit
MQQSQKLLCLIFAVASSACYFVKASAAGQETLIGIRGKDFIILGADSSSASSITLTSSQVDKIKILSNPFPNSEYGSLSVQRSRRTTPIAIASAGENADCERLVGQLALHVTQTEYENGLGSDVQSLFHGSFNDESSEDIVGLDAESVAFFARSMIAKAMRTRSRMNACALIAGMVPKRIDDDSSHNDISYNERIQSQIKLATKQGIDESDKISLTNSNKEQGGLEPKLFWLDEYGALQTLDYGSHGLGSNFCLSILDRNYRKDMTREEAVKLINDCFEQLNTRYVINSPQKPCIKCIDETSCKIY